MDSLEQFILQVDRPLGYAARAMEARRETVRGLGRYVSRQLGQLGPAGTARSRLLLRRLERLFRDYDDVDETRRAKKLAVARQIMADLQAGVGRPDAQKVDPGVDNSIGGSIERLPGVGIRRAAQFRRLGVQTIEELLLALPWRYEDRSRVQPVAGLRPGDDQTVSVDVKAVGSGRTARRRMVIVELIVGDATGLLSVKWFNQPYLRDQFRAGQRLMLTGRLRVNRRGSPRYQMENPHYELIDDDSDELLHSGRVVPVYHETKGLSSRVIRTIVRRAIDMYADIWPEVLPPSVDEAGALMGVAQALEEVHFPPAGTTLQELQAGRSAALRRLIFEELFVLSIGLASRKRAVADEVVPARAAGEGPLRRRFLQKLGFSLTAAQRRVLAEIEADLRQPHPMNRLLQGDVGCGKTVVAVLAMLMACDHGSQAALMAPTEILAEQHALTLGRWCAPLGLDLVLLTSGMRAAARRTALLRIRDGTARIVIGTHALLTGNVVFDRLGMVVVDEQHKFGVLQRADLVGKGYHPDVLVMTATPIPRTLALTVYGDLDLSVIDEMPPGRPPVTTTLLRETQWTAADRLLTRELSQGRQAYVIYPLVEESEKIDLRAATRMAKSLQERFPSFRVGLLHGRLSVEQKEEVMKGFAAGSVQILVSTSVVEVGIDVPNATVMIIEHAERFGLAQLHQFRGRIGRGRAASTCLLIAADRIGDEARRRLAALVQTRDGFRIAEADLAIRGPGEFLGTRQSGLPDLRVAHLIRDADLLERARRAADRLLQSDPHLSGPPHRLLRSAVERRWMGRLALMSVS